MSSKSIKDIFKNKTITDDPLYNLSDLNWKDDTLENGIGDIDGSDPSIKGYNRGWNEEPYKQRYYARLRRKNMSRLKTSAVEVTTLLTGAEQYVNKLLEIWAETDGPLQNFFDGFTMNKIDNATKIEMARILEGLGYHVNPVLIDEQVRTADNNFKPYNDIQLSDESLNSIEKLFNCENSSLTKNTTDNSSINDFGYNTTTQMNSDISVQPNQYEVRVSRLKKNTK